MPQKIKNSFSKAIIVIPGYKGSFLEQDHSVLWINLWSLLFSSKNDLTYSDISRVRASKILDRVPLIYPFYKDFYYSFIRTLSAQLPDFNVVPFSYDWRRPLSEIISDLSLFISKLREEGVTHFDFVAHSLGGVLLSYYLKYGVQHPENGNFSHAHTKGFRTVFFAGVPFRGTAKSFRDIHLGERVALNKTLLSSDVVRTFPVAYHLFPIGDPFIFEGPNRHPLDVFNLENWKTRNIIGYASLSLKNQNFIERHITAGRLFFQKILSEDPMPPTIKFINIYGYGSKTLCGCTLNASNILFDQFTDGDGTISAHSAKGPQCIATTPLFQEIPVRRSHLSLLNNSKVIRLILNELARVR